MIISIYIICTGHVDCFYRSLRILVQTYIIATRVCFQVWEFKNVISPKYFQLLAAFDVCSFNSFQNSRIDSFFLKINYISQHNMYSNYSVNDISSFILSIKAKQHNWAVWQTTYQTPSLNMAVFDFDSPKTFVSRFFKCTN